MDDDTELLDLLPDPVLGLDRDRRIVHWNAAAEQLYGYARAEALSRTGPELLRMRFAMPLAEILELVTDTGEWSGDAVLITKDGRELTVESHWSARYDECGELAGVLAIDRDITARLAGLGDDEPRRATFERRRLQRRMHRSERLETIGQLAGGIAHDFNNSLAVIINYAALIAPELEREERQTGQARWGSVRADLREIEAAAQRAARLTHQLLAFSREDLGNPVECSLNEAVEQSLKLLERTIGEHITLEVSLDPGLRPVMADPGQLEQTLVSLAVNSRDAMPNGGRLSIETMNIELDAECCTAQSELEPGAYVRLRVSDTGVGMTPEVIEHAFDPFFTTKSVGQGTGLGLATVYGVIRRVGGSAQFYSEAGLGTTFVALLPASEAKVAPASPPVPLARGSGQTILLVEDEDALREATRRILEQAGYTVVAVSEGALALEVAGEHEIDLLLTDVVMPEMQGHQLAAEMKARDPGLKALFISGFAQPVFAEASQMTAEQLIEKPYTAQVLLARVADALVRTAQG